ncbi:TPA: hypothetical protein OTX96_001087 [Pseudomonas aeruginosa]|nr:hypothetical protein [Pseudomonas aeruginosa]
MTESKICTCPSGDGSLRWPCPAHSAAEQAGGDERAAFEVWASALGWKLSPDQNNCGIVVAERYGHPGVQRCWEAWQARAALAQPSPVRSSLLINGYQLRAALDFIAPDGTAEQLESEACIEWRQQDADFLEAGLYAFCAEYPEEGGVLLDEEPTTAQPSPLQSEQAEAERPEVVAYFDRNYPSTGDAFIWSNYEGSPYEPVMTVAQHERIVGAHAGAIRLLADSVARLRAECNAALARVEQQERTIAGMNEAHAKLAGLYEAAQAQHSVPGIAESVSECMALAQTVFARMEGLMPCGKKLPEKHVARRLLAELETLAKLAAAPAPGGE